MYNLLVAAALASLNHHSAPSGHSNSRALEATNCTNTCNHALDGTCDDGGHGSEYTICAHGSDCVDCGPPTASSESSGEWWISFLLTQDIVHLSGGLSPSILEANAMLQIRFTADQNPEDLFPAERDMIKTTIRNSLYQGCSHGGGCPPLEEIAMTLLQGSMVVTVTAFFPDQATANSAGATLMSDWNSPTFQSELGVNATSAPTVSVAPTTGSGGVLSFSSPIIYAVASLILCMTGCVLGSSCAKQARKAPSSAYKSASKEVPYRGCCSTGCCSTYAINGWAWTTGIACIFLLVSMGMLYHTMLAVTDAIICILDQIYDLRNSASADMHVATEGIGPILDLIEPLRPNLVLLSEAVVVPGVFAALFMFLSSLCACGHHAGCSKFFLLITYIFIIFSFVIGVVATALGPLIQNLTFRTARTGPEGGATNAGVVVTAICEITLPVLEQHLYDTRTTMSNAMTNGADATIITELESLLLDDEELVEKFGIACGCLVEFVNTAFDLFSPGICNIIASIFALYASCFSCWTTGCCVAPHTAKTSQVTSAGMIFGLCFGNCWGRRARLSIRAMLPTIKVETGIPTVCTSSSASAGKKGASSSSSSASAGKKGASSSSSSASAGGNDATSFATMSIMDTMSPVGKRPDAIV
jgi:hypothetical protein